ncbi:MAG: phosphate ABC transporter permease subunit PstC [Rhizobiales bacterium NRL2]|jgi:phosphate transport system permease protein|nr:MAG: phosphate ABC transporter permease subunit PstC [Rhizobiales bacterium NRL2]
MYEYAFLAIVVIAAAGYFLGRSRAVAVSPQGRGIGLHSLPAYYGAYVALWVGLPVLVLVLIWLSLQGPVVDQLLLASLPEELLAGKGEGQIDLIVSEIKSIAGGRIFGEPGRAVLDAAESYNRWHDIADMAMLVVVLAGALGALVLTRSRIAAGFRARHGVERILTWLMIFCSVVAILTTLGIIFSLLFESFRFFSRVPFYEFLFGLNWEPQIPIREDQVAAAGAFGAIPVFLGTILIAFIAMLVAGPVGLLSAIYLAEYASPRFRGVVKPILEILAGIPTVVYGFFAVLTVAPALRSLGDAIGLDMAPNSALVAGAVMGIMIIPFISSLSDDAFAAVPQSMRDASYGLGATQAETILSVLIPAALPGIVGGFLLAVSRAIGETMIVVMAAGLIAKLTVNPFEAVTTVTVQIVTLLIGDTEFDSPKTLAAFALGLVLFTATLMLNVVALRIVRKYREKYE